MSTFLIQVKPAIPQAVCFRSDFPDQNLRWSEIVRVVPEKLQIVFIYDNLRFGYHPADVVSTLNDLVGEWRAFKNGQSHYVSVAGYNVSYARYFEGHVWFLDIPREFGTEDSLVLLGEGVPVDDVRKAFQASASAVWDYIARKMDGDKEAAGRS